MHTDIAIIGGGLSGLATADLLLRAGYDWQLLEARDRLGGRILSLPAREGASKSERYDLGPAWIWPHNPRALALTNKLGLEVFPQHAEGRLVFQDGSGYVRRDMNFSTMAGSLRIGGGMHALTQGLVDRLLANRLSIEAPVIRISEDRAGLRVTGPNVELSARMVVLALPPRIAAQISFAPNLPEAAVLALSAIPTWMAGQAKAVAVYSSPFWRGQGLSGDGISQRGPMVEIHDASPSTGGEGALFGFIGVSPDIRQADNTGLRTAILHQFGEMFGPEAENPDALLLQDWAAEAATCTKADFAPLREHPAYDLPPALKGLMGGRLVFAGSETAREQGGFLEGALVAAEAAVAQVTKTGMPVPS